MSFKNFLLNFIIFAISITIIPSFVFEYQIRDPSEFFVPKISITLILIGILIWYFHQSDEDDDDYYANVYEDNNYFKRSMHDSYKIKNKDFSYCQRSDVKTYDNITDAYTKEKVDELIKSNLFKKMFEEKGEDKENWNWQSRDRLKGIKQKDEDEISSDEIENMSVSQD